MVVDRLNTPEARSRSGYQLTDEDRRKATVEKAERSQLSRAVKISKAISRLDPSIGAKIRERGLEMPSFCVETYLKAMRGRNPTIAIKAFCEMCFGWENRVEEIRECTDPACPLYPYRPY